MSTLQSCLGGWCTKRDHCAHYHAASPDQTPAERLCPPGQDGAGLQHLVEEEIELTTTRGTVARVQSVIADGMSVAEIAAAAGVHITNARGAVRILSEEGKVFTCRVNPEGSKQHFVMVFLSPEKRDAQQAECDELARAKQRRFKAAYRARLRRAAAPARQAREAARQQAEQERAQREAAEAQTRAMRAAEAELAKQRARLDREAKAAAKAREKTEAKKQRLRLKVETAQAGQLVFKKGTEVARPKKLSFADMPVVNPDAVKPKVIPSNLVDRFAVDKAPSVISSNDCREWAKAAA